MRRWLVVVVAVCIVTGCTTADTRLPVQGGASGTATSLAKGAKGTATAVPKPQKSPAGIALVSSHYGTPATLTTLVFYMRHLERDINTMWGQEFTDQGRTWKPVTVHILPQGVVLQSPCGPAGDPDSDPELPNPAFYCPSNKSIYLSATWIEHNVWFPHTGQTAKGNPVVRLGGDLGVALVTAHEMGHAVQDQDGAGAAAGDPVRPTELQADCYAGIWAYAKFAAGEIDSQVAAALDAVEDVGDTSEDPAQHHGTPDQRGRAFFTGYQNGDPAACVPDVGANS